MIYSVYADGVFIKNCETLDEVRKVISENLEAKSFEIITKDSTYK